MNGRTLRSMNGWRAVSVLLVLTSHAADSKRWIDGELGVRFFFMISGLLITWLMLQEEAERSEVSLSRFYARRCLRILPLYFTYLGIALALQVSGLVAQSNGSWRGLLTFTRNFFSTGSSGDWLTVHFWSLSVEEQFYLVWPLAFCLMANRGRIIFLFAAICFSVGFRSFQSSVPPTFEQRFPFLFQKFSTFNYLDCLGWGCIGAFVLVQWRSQIESACKKRPDIIFSFCFAAVLLPYIVGFGKGIQAVGFVGLLLHSVVHPEWGLYRALNNKWMDKIGVISYSIYIWQEPICFAWPRALAAVWFLKIPIALGIGYASYEFLEKPFLGLRARLRKAQSQATSVLAV